MNGRLQSSYDVTSYTPHDFEQNDALSEFTVGLSDDFSLDTLILNGGERGWALDSSWRNKNENRAAVTFLIGVDENMHAMPGKDSFWHVMDIIAK